MSPYKVLGISPNASKGEIRKAYRAKMREFHPDRHGMDSKSHEKFVQVQDAYRILQKRGSSSGVQDQTPYQSSADSKVQDPKEAWIHTVPNWVPQITFVEALVKNSEDAEVMRGISMASTKALLGLFILRGIDVAKTVSITAILIYLSMWNPLFLIPLFLFGGASYLAFKLGAKAVGIYNDEVKKLSEAKK